MNVSLIGMMGSGKTTAGRLLADKTGRRFVDTDHMIEEEKKMSIADIFSRLGEPEFRGFEKEAVKKLLKTDNLVISTGGGLPIDVENMDNLKKMGPVIWLLASPRATLRRVSKTEKRPLLDVEKPLEMIKLLLERRERCYGRADFKIDTTGKSPARTADEIMKFLEECSHDGHKP